MCNIMMMQSRLPAAIDDPALRSTSAKPLLLSLPVLRIAGRKPEPSSEKFVRSPSGVSFENKAFQQRSQAKITELKRTASAETSTNSLLAQKALKFRGLLERVPFARAAAVQC